MSMHALSLRGIGRLGTIFVFGLAFWATVGAGLARADEDSQGSAIFWGGSEAPPRSPWYVSSDAMMMQRLFSGLGAAAILVPSATAAQTIALSQQDLNEPFQAGVKLLIGHTFGDSPYRLEGSYYWLAAWTSSAQVNDAAGDLNSPFTTPFGILPNDVVDHNTFVEIQQVSRLESGDLDLKYLLSLPDGYPTIELLLGVRHIAVREEFDYSSLPLLDVNPVSVHAHTNNNLWGPQIGSVVEYGHQETWLRFEGKFAFCNNAANRDLDANANGVDVTHPHVGQNATAMAADVTAAVIWRPTTAITAKVGYQALWVDQLALAGRNYAFDYDSLQGTAPEPPLNERGTLIYHGPFAGLELAW
jgi:hypothetical protein